MARLIVNADDFGYTPGINQAVVELHRAGALTSTTLMACGSALEDALLLLRVPAPDPLVKPLGVGCHVVLVDGVPSSPFDQVPSLLAPPPHPGATASPFAARSFRSSLAVFAADLLRGRIKAGEVEREAIAQIRSVQARGIPVTHLDTHKHTHMFPSVLRPLLRAALQCGVRAIRNPFEPEWSRQATPGAPLIRRAEVSFLSHLQPGFLSLVAQAGLATTAGSLGVLATGTLDHTALASLLTVFGRQADDHAVFELVCHPGYRDTALDAQPTRLRQQRETERTALLDAKHRMHGLPLVHFGDLAGLAPPPAS